MTAAAADGHMPREVVDVGLYPACGGNAHELCRGRAIKDYAGLVTDCSCACHRDGLVLSPDCRDGKHAACVGEAWDDRADAPADCTCTCHADQPPIAERVYTGGHAVAVDVVRRWPTP